MIVLLFTISLLQLSVETGIEPQFVDEPADQKILDGPFANVTCGAKYPSLTMPSEFTMKMFCFSGKGWNVTYFMIQNKTTAGNIPNMNNTVTRITYKLQLHRDKSDLAVIYCYCNASINQVTKRSRIAKISFPTGKTVPLAKDSATYIDTFILAAATAAAIIVFILLVSVVYRNRIKMRTRMRAHNIELPDHFCLDTETIMPEVYKVTTNESSVSSVEDPREPVEDFTLHPSVPKTEDRETNCDNESGFHGEESLKSKSNISAFYPKPKLPDTIDPNLCTWGHFTEKGGRLTIEGTGVRLYIPPNALPEETLQVIYIGLMNSKGTYPKLSDQEALLSPVVVCGPDGLTFKKPVFLTVPHNAVLDENNCWNPKVQSCSTVDEEERVNRWKVLERPEGDAPLSHVSEKEMHIMIDHFTYFAVVGEASPTQEANAQLKAWIIAYYTEPKVNEDCMTRIYCIPATDAAYKVLEGIESRLNGKMSDSQKLLKICNNSKHLQVTSKMTHEGWSAVTGEQKSITFEVIWQCTEQSPNVSFIFERVSPQVFKFRSTFDARQEESVTGVEVLVCFSIEAIRRYSSGYESQASGCQFNAHYKIPTEIRRELCHLLDPENPMFNDWRFVAEKLGFDQVYISYLKGNPKIRSPTDELIEMWETKLSEKKPLPHIEEIFREMERHDVVQVLQKIPGLKSTRQEEEQICSV